jgi:hypothetical protein
MNAPLRTVTTTVLLLSAALANAQQQTISVGEAKELVSLVLRHQGFPSSSQHCQVESLDKNGKPFAPDYYAFGASCDFPNTAATSPWGTYLVSPRTGEVLNFDTCKWLGYHDLRECQKQIMLQTGATEDSERRYRDGTGCEKTK